MNIDEFDSAACRLMKIDEEARLFVRSRRSNGQAVQGTQHFPPIRQVSAGQLTDHHRVDQYPELLKQGRKTRLPAAQVVDPDRGVYQDQSDWARRRATSRRCGLLPPSFASLRALSRSIRARRPSATRAVRVWMPVSCSALSSKSSSRLMVVLMSKQYSIDSVMDMTPRAGRPTCRAAVLRGGSASVAAEEGRLWSG